MVAEKSIPIISVEFVYVVMGEVKYADSLKFR